MNKIPSKVKWIKPFFWFQWLALAGVSLGVVITISFFWYYQNRFYPGVTIQSIPVGGLTKLSATQLLHEKLPPLSDFVVTLQAENRGEIASSSAQLGIVYDTDTAIDVAFQHGRTGRWRFRPFTLLQTSVRTVSYTVPLKADPFAVQNLVHELALTINQPGKPATATLAVSNKPETITVFAGQEGFEVDEAATMSMVAQEIMSHKQSIPAVVTHASPPLNQEQLQAAQERSTKLVGKSLLIAAEGFKKTLNDQQLIALLSFPEGLNQTKTTELLDLVSNKVNRPAQEPELEFDEKTQMVTTFVPPQNGLAVETDSLYTTIDDSIKTLIDQSKTQLELPLPIHVPVTISPPARSLSELNNLGIIERIGVGESEYAHSIPTRIHNVALAASRINNILIKPGEQFSFNKALGDVSKQTGYKPAYVIQSGQTVLGDGGGVCQVSTTMFRASLNAGLPITKRKAHSYRVSYYELDSKPGVDATVYSGDVDLRFVNDTGHHILVHTQTDSKNLYMKIELYGTSDGRTASITDHKTWDLRSAPAPVYISDPSLPAGVTKQIDWAASGIKASFKNEVKDKDGKIIRVEEYYSNYIPWSAKYLKGGNG